jgi:phosphonate transport system substrate-binding protein
LQKRFLFERYNRLMLLKLRRSLLLLILLLSACAPRPNLTLHLDENRRSDAVWIATPTRGAGWRIGFDPRLEPKDDVRQVASLADWLSRQTGLSFSVYITEQDGNIVDDLCAGKADFAVVGTVSYLQANDQCGASILVRGRNMEGEDTYRAAIIVAPESSIQSLKDLRGVSFAFGALNSTQGHLIPRLMLQQAGIRLEDFSAYTYTGSHAATANAVTSGRYQAGALQDTLALDLARRGLVRILALSDPYPSSGVVAGPHVPQQTAEMVRRALLQLDPTAAALYQWQRTEMPLGFVTARDDEYEELRRIARLIGLLAP